VNKRIAKVNGGKKSAIRGQAIAVDQLSQARFKLRSLGSH